MAAVLVWNWLMASAPTADRKPRERVARLVEVAPAEAAQQGPVITAWGEVQAAQTLVVRPEIGGTLEWVHPDVTSGGLLTAGTEVARIDSRDLRLALTRAEADIAEIEARIQIEKGQAELGERELDTAVAQYHRRPAKALVLREPQMAQLRAELAAAQAALEQAKNALARTTVKVPFDALGGGPRTVSPGRCCRRQGAEAATLVASDRFHVSRCRSRRCYLDWIRIDGTQQVN